jgi:DNA-binding winged helix-turn-helix (wHTH) protein
MPIAPSRRHLYRFGPFRYDPDDKSLARDGDPRPLRLKRMSLLLLEFFLGRPGQLIPRESIRALLWPERKLGLTPTASEENALDQQISLLRTELKKADGSPTNYITSEKCKGFRFNVEVKEEGGRVALTVLPFRYSPSGRKGADLEFELRDALIRRLTLNPALNVRHAESNRKAALAPESDQGSGGAVERGTWAGRVVTGAVFIRGPKLRVTFQLIGAGGYYEQTPEPVECELAESALAAELIAAHIERALHLSPPGGRRKQK